MTDQRPNLPSVTDEHHRTGIDPRGPRVAATITSVVLALAVVTGSIWVLALQTLVFAAGCLFGVQRSPYAWVYRRLVRPRLGPPSELESPAPPRFAQTVGLAVTAVGLVLALLGLRLAVEISAGLAFVAAFLNASMNFCLGCRIYLLMASIRTPADSRRPSAS